jgi:nucleoid-associated protein YgaU
VRKDVKIGMFLGLVVSVTVAGVLLTKGNLGLNDVEPMLTPESLKTESGRPGDSAGSAVSSAPQKPSPAVQPATPSAEAKAPASAAVEDKSAAPAPTKATRFYIIQPGDTLSSIAKKYYGSSAAMGKVYEANKAAFPNRDRLKVGTKIVIPD